MGFPRKLENEETTGTEAGGEIGLRTDAAVEEEVFSRSAPSTPLAPRLFARPRRFGTIPKIVRHAPPLAGRRACG